MGASASDIVSDVAEEWYSRTSFPPFWVAMDSTGTIEGQRFRMRYVHWVDREQMGRVNTKSTDRELGLLEQNESTSFNKN